MKDKWGKHPVRIWIVAGALVCCAPRVHAGKLNAPRLLFSPTAEVVRFDAVAEEGRVIVRWETFFEEGVNAFRVVRQFEGGISAEVGVTRARGFEEGYAYEQSDPSAHVGDSVHYDLFILSNQDEQQVASWKGIVEIAPEKPVRMVLAEPMVLAEESIPVSERKCWIGNGDRVQVWTDASPADRVRLSLTEEGLYRVPAQELADAGGWDITSVSNAIVTTNFSMSCQGDPIAWLADGDGLIFHGLPAESRYAPENVYWVEFGPGQHMATLDGTPPENATTNAWFMDHIEFQGTDHLYRFSRSSLADAPAQFLSFGPGYFLNGDSEVYDFTLSGCVQSNWDGEVSVNLISIYEVGVDNHTGRVSVGTIPIGEPAWSGEQYISFNYPFSSTNVNEGGVTLGVSNVATDPPDSATDYTRFLFVSCEFTYARHYLAENGALRCSGGAGNTLAVSGFSSNNVVVLDVSTANQPVVLEPVDLVFDGIASNWTAAFSCGDSGQMYQVCSKSTGLRQPSVRGVHDVDWTSPANAADYVILMPPEGWVEGFRHTLQELADYRNAQGLKTRIVDVESLYNQFSYGLVESEAIRQFCRTGILDWVDQPLRYLLLAGDGIYDFKHTRFSVNDYTACLIPPLIAGQSFSEGSAVVVVIDTAYGDVNDDGSPELSVGRIPTTSTNELSIVVNKTKQYEEAILREEGSLAKKFVAVAPDWTDIPGSSMYYPFDHAADRILAPLEAADRTHVPCRADPSFPNDLYSVKVNSLIPSLAAGVGIFHFFGHSHPYYLGHSGYYDGNPGSNLFRYGDISTSNWEIPTIAVFVGCNPNIWQYMTPIPVLIPVGLFAEGTGFVAALGATGYMLADEGEELGVYLFNAAAEQETLRLGDMHRLAIKEAIENPLNPTRLSYSEQDQVVDRLHCFNLVGDPALVIRHDITAMGTDTEWLADHGQTAANADLEDPDLDGWQTWQEYQSDSNPTNFVLQFHGTLLPNESGSQFLLSFETTTHQNYQIEYTPSLLTTGAWQAVSWAWEDSAEWFSPETRISPTEPVTTLQVTNESLTTQGFFRVRGEE